MKLVALCGIMYVLLLLVLDIGVLCVALCWNYDGIMLLFFNSQIVLGNRGLSTLFDGIMVVFYIQRVSLTSISSAHPPHPETMRSFPLSMSLLLYIKVQKGFPHPMPNSDGVLARTYRWSIF